MKIATWNINGVKARLDNAVTWLKEAEPDVVCLQEIKSVDEGFPRGAFEDLGYNVETHGQKGFNGVAILSKRKPDEVRRGLPGNDGDEHARYIEADIAGDNGVVTVASIYLPNGNPIGTEKFSYKLAWMQRLEAHARARLAHEMPLVLAGDFNVIPEPMDARRPDAWVSDALYQPESRAMSYPRGARLHRRDARLLPARRALHVLGLSGRRLAEEPRHPHRPHAALATGRRQAAGKRHRQGHPRARKALRPRTRLGRTRHVIANLCNCCG